MHFPMFSPVLRSISVRFLRHMRHLFHVRLHFYYIYAIILN